MTKDEIVDAPLMTEAPSSTEASSAAQTVASEEGKAPAKRITILAVTHSAGMLFRLFQALSRELL